MKKSLIIQHYDATSAGSTVHWFQQNNIAYDIWRIDLQAEPDLKKYDAVIVCGGRHNVDEEHLYPWMKKEKQIIKEWAERGAPMVGLCLGGQLIAEALGGEVGPHHGWEIGWHPVQVLDTDEMLMAFQFHQYRFIPPTSAQLLVEGDYCKYQAYSYKNAIGFQFHPESSKEWIFAAAKHIDKEMQGNVQTEKQITESMHHLHDLQDWYFKTLTQWAKKV